MNCRVIDFKSIPVQADIISGIIHLDAESNTSFRELDNYVSSDQGVAALILRVVNSALYGRGRQIVSIPMAISVLGFNVVRSLAMLAFSRSLFTHTQNELFHIHIWQHSLLTGLAGQLICQNLGDAARADEAFIAGLMHDMGKVMLFTHDEQAYLEVLSLILEHGWSSVEAERKVFGCDHCEVGAEAAKKWNLPEYFIGYMGINLRKPLPDFAQSPVHHSLAAANQLVNSFGIGARALEDIEARKAGLVYYGLSEELSDTYASEGFINELMENETYQLCINL